MSTLNLTEYRNAKKFCNDYFCLPILCDNC